MCVQRRVVTACADQASGPLADFLHSYAELEAIQPPGRTPGDPVRTNIASGLPAVADVGKRVNCASASVIKPAQRRSVRRGRNKSAWFGASPPTADRTRRQCLSAAPSRTLGSESTTHMDTRAWSPNSLPWHTERSTPARRPDQPLTYVSSPSAASSWSSSVRSWDQPASQRTSNDSLG
jgi:hypothetical protein